MAMVRYGVAVKLWLPFLFREPNFMLVPYFLGSSVLCASRFRRLLNESFTCHNAHVFNEA